MCPARIAPIVLLLLVPTTSTAAPIPMVDVSSSGVFTGPPVGGLAGMGTSQITFGEGVGGSPPSYIQFVGGSISAAPGVMTIGHLNFFNGVIASDSLTPNPFGFNLQMTVSIDGTPTTISVPMSQFSTLNDGSTLNNADTLTLGALPSFAFSSNGNDYTFQLLGFGPVTGDGFGDATSMTAYEWGASLNHNNNHTASGLVTAPVLGQVTAVSTPEPATLAVAGLLAATGGLFFRRRRA